MRNLLNTQRIEDFLDNNPSIMLECYINRGHHPYIRTEYINGWNRTIPLRNKTEDEIIDILKGAKD